MAESGTNGNCGHIHITHRHRVRKKRKRHTFCCSKLECACIVYVSRGNYHTCTTRQPTAELKWKRFLPPWQSVRCIDSDSMAARTERVEICENTRISSLNKHKITTSFSDKSHFIMLLEYMNTYTTTSHTSSIIFYWLSAGKLLPFY